MPAGDLHVVLCSPLPPPRTLGWVLSSTRIFPGVLSEMVLPLRLFIVPFQQQAVTATPPLPVSLVRRRQKRGLFFEIIPGNSAAFIPAQNFLSRAEVLRSQPHVR